MGALTSRQNAGVEEVDVGSNHAYKYPPRSGNYFGSHFIMGGERFDTPQPEAYLFGENTDLNFLGSRPTSFPYPPPQANEPTKTLKSMVNIRKESLRFVRNTESGKLSEHGDGDKNTQFNIEFTFDCDSLCSITIYYFCTEELSANGVIYNPRDPSMNSHTYRYKRGANQQFSQDNHVFDPSRYSEEDLLFNPDKDIFPIAIHCVVEDGSDEVKQSHTTIAVVEKHSDGTYVLKALKQKLFVDGLCYLLQEIYGIENKNAENIRNNADEDGEDNGSECVICMSDVRDTLILPCKHLCLCNSCADSLRYQANNCPICRAPFRALLQIRALQKQTGQPQALPASPPDGSSENIPAGYEAVSLIEALNGPCPVRVTMPPTPQTNHQPLNTTPAAAEGDTTIQAAEALNRCNMERHSSSSIVGNTKLKNMQGGSYKSPKDLEGKSLRDRSIGQGNTPEFRMSVLLARDEENSKLINGKNTATSPLLVKQKSDESNGEDMDGEGDSQEGEVECEGDSDAEKLSPLLTDIGSSCDTVTPNTKPKMTNKNNGVIGNHVAVPNGQMMNAAKLPLHLDAVIEPIDDTDTDEPEQLSSASVGGPPMAIESEVGPTEDSDYFTPEDTQTTILTSPLHQNNTKQIIQDPLSNPLTVSSSESTPQRWAAPHHVSLPGTPLSHVSNRSSGDSYSSSSSTRQLLATGGVTPNNVANAVPHHQPTVVHAANIDK